MKLNYLLFITLVASQQDITVEPNVEKIVTNVGLKSQDREYKIIHDSQISNQETEVKLSDAQHDGVLKFHIPTALNYEDLVNKAKSKIDIKEMTRFLTKFSSFHNRYYNSDYGKDSAEFLFNQVNSSAQSFTSKFTTEYFKHTWKQPSIIARLEGTEESDQIIIIGAHMDSINENDPMNGRAPGADDDGSGVTSILGAINSLQKIDFHPKKTIEFHFYAGEEVGFVGSNEIAKKYKEDKKNIVGMLMVEMTGMNNNDRAKLMTDYTDPELSDFLRKTIIKYTKYTPFDSKCDYPCSDHFSFYEAGYRTCVPATETINFKLHTPEDTMEYIDMENVAEFSKLVLGFLIELSEPSIKSNTIKI